MPRHEVSGCLDDGVIARDEFLFPQKKPRPRVGSTMGSYKPAARPSTASLLQRMHIYRSSYEPVARATNQQRQQQQNTTDMMRMKQQPPRKVHLCHENTNEYDHMNHPVQYEPLVTSKSLHEQLNNTDALDDSDKLRELIMEKTASYASNNDDLRHITSRQFPYTTNETKVEPHTRYLIEGPSRRVGSTIPGPNELVSRGAVTFDVELVEDDEDYVCCDLHSASRQPFCNEGTKNLCTLVVWAVFIVIIIHRFVMHLSIFLHHGTTVEMKPAR